MTNVTLSGNSADSGSGIYWGGSSGELLTLKNTLIAHGSKGLNCGYVPGGSFSLSDDGSCSFGAGRDNVNLLLGPLANNGGLTPTHLPQPSSPAIENAGGADCPSTDQRGFTRAGQGIACDVGRSSVGPPIPALRGRSICRSSSGRWPRVSHGSLHSADAWLCKDKYLFRQGNSADQFWVILAGDRDIF